MTDPISDLLTRIRNALGARKQTVDVPASKVKEAILRIFKAEGFIENFIRQEADSQDVLKIFLRYRANHQPIIHQLMRVSRPGGRVYQGYREIRPFLSGMGVTIFSTPMGVISDKEARQKKVGGEVLCSVW